MSFLSYKDVRIAGISACVPDKEFYIEDYDWVPLEERKSLIEKTGVYKKRHADSETTTSDLCYVAAEKLLQELKWDKSEIDAIVFLSQSRDYILPATACILQDRMKLSKTTMAFDIEHGCTGFIYGLSVVHGLLQSGQLKKALFLVGETPVKSCSYKDKTTYPLFGDAGTATALEYKEGYAPAYFNLQTFGKDYNAIIIPESGFRKLPSKKTFDERKIKDGIFRHKGQIHLNGYKIFQFTLKEVLPNLKSLLDFSKKSINSFDYIIFHQSNKLINEVLRSKIGIDSCKTPESLSEYGNTSSASIPLTMVAKLRNELNTRQQDLLLSAFGAGLSVASAYIHTDELCCTNVINYKDYKEINTGEY